MRIVLMLLFGITLLSSNAQIVEIEGKLKVSDVDSVSNNNKVLSRASDGTIIEYSNTIRVSLTGDTLVMGGKSIIIPGISAANYPTDGDGNTYEVVSINGEEWLKTNLRTTKYNDGTPINHAASMSAWNMANLNSTPSYSIYDTINTGYILFDHINFGYLYNWYVVDSLSNGNKNVCPEGFHVPSLNELNQLYASLDGASVAGGKLKSEGTIQLGNGFWYAPNSGSSPRTGFAINPGGFRNFDGEFGVNTLGRYATLWTKTPFNSSFSYHSGFFNANSIVDTIETDNGNGLSIRCKRD